MTAAEQTRNMYPAWRVFIFGVEVTEDVTSCTLNYTDTRAPNTCEFELTNNLDKYIVTKSDIAALYDDIPDLDALVFPDTQVSLSASLDGDVTAAVASTDLAALAEAKTAAEAAVNKRADHIDREVLRRLDNTLPEGSAKSAVLQAKATVRQQLPAFRGASPGTSAGASLRDLPALNGQVLRYPFQVGDAIWHSNDPVRVFWRDPANPADWYHMFSGFVTDWTDSVDVNNVRTLRVRCEDVSRILRYARITTNPGVFDINDAQTAADSVLRTFFSKGFANMTLPELLFTLVFGSDKAGTTGELNASTTQAATATGGRQSVVRGDSAQVQPPFVYDDNGVKHYAFEDFDTAKAWALEVATAMRRNNDVPQRILPIGQYDRTFSIEVDNAIVRNDTRGWYRALLESQDIDLAAVFFRTLDDELRRNKPKPTGGVSNSEQRRVAGVRPFRYTRVGVAGQTESDVSADGAGAFDFGGSFIGVIGPDGEDSVLPPELQSRVVTLNNLGQWQAIIDHKVQVSDIVNMLLPEERDNRDVVDDGDVLSVADVIQTIGTHPELYPVDGGGLMMLLPASLGPGSNRDLLMRDLASSIATHTTWQTRLGLIYDAIGRIDFSFYATPKGDLVCEMPLYDFQPYEFGEEAVDVVEINRTLRRVGIGFGDDETRGPYAPHFIVPKHDTISWERGFSDENIRTQMIVQWSLIKGQEDLAPSRTIGQQSAVNLRGLWPSFGVRSEVMESNGVVHNEEAALLYGAVKLNQTNADARSAHVEALPRVQWVWPNRPLEFTERSYVATTRAITLSIVWNSDVSCSLDVNYVRGWSGQKDSADRPVYEPIGGFASSDLNYAVRWGQRADVATTKAR